MELKVWVDGVLRVVCGLSEETSCQDVVIALAQAIGEYLKLWNSSVVILWSSNLFVCSAVYLTSLNCQITLQPGEFNAKRFCAHLFDLCASCWIVRGSVWMSADSLSLCLKALYKPYAAAALNNITPDLALSSFHEWAACQVIREGLS